MIVFVIVTLTHSPSRLGMEIFDRARALERLTHVSPHSFRRYTFVFQFVNGGTLPFLLSGMFSNAMTT